LRLLPQNHNPEEGLGEAMTWKTLLGSLLIVGGTMIMIM